MRSALVVFALLLSGCYSAPFEPAAECHAEGVGPIYLQSARPCECIVARVEEARRVWRDEVGLPADFRLDGVALWVHDTPTFLHDDVTAEHVRQGARVDIYLNRQIGGLVHEGLHEWQYRNGATPEAEHVHLGWRESVGVNGWNWEMIDGVFEAESLRTVNRCE